MDGFEVCPEARTLSQHKRTPILMLIGLDRMLNRAPAMMAGATDLLRKPNMLAELRTILLENLRR